MRGVVRSRLRQQCILNWKGRQCQGALPCAIGAAPRRAHPGPGGWNNALPAAGHEGFLPSRRRVSTISLFCEASPWVYSLTGVLGCSELRRQDPPSRGMPVSVPRLRRWILRQTRTIHGGNLSRSHLPNLSSRDKTWIIDPGDETNFEGRPNYHKVLRSFSFRRQSRGSSVSGVNLQRGNESGLHGLLDGDSNSGSFAGRLSYRSDQSSRPSR